MPRSPFPFDPETWRLLTCRLCLPPQQVRVAELLLLDRSNRQIAEAMALAEPTVCSYVTRLFDAVGVDSRLALALRLMALVREGWHLSTDDMDADGSGSDAIRGETYASPETR